MSRIGIGEECVFGLVCVRTSFGLRPSVFGFSPALALSAFQCAALHLSFASIMKIVLAYSGGLDTSVLLSWIKENYDAEMIAFCANIGQEEELKGLQSKAKKTGASKVYISDLQAEFARDFIFPMIQAGAIYEGQYLLGTSIARPLIAKGMIEVARKEKSDALAHGATGKGN